MIENQVDFCPVPPGVPETAEKNTSIEVRLVRLLKKACLTIATAESLTGGTVSGMITAVPGASEVIELGVCSYSNRIKHEILGVGQDTLLTFTEYSLQTAKEMAAGVRRLAGADIGVAATGIAGPGGGTEEKPVGTVYIGISSKLGDFAHELSLGNNGKNDRETVRRLSAIHALQLSYETAEALFEQKDPDEFAKCINIEG